MSGMIELTPKEAYDSHLFTSSCCHQWIIHEGANCICSQCHRLITQLDENETLTLMVKFNNEHENNISADLQKSFKVKARRFATDPTYELCAVRCPKCKSLSRYARDPQGTMIFICSSGKCRHVFTNDEAKK